MPTARAFRGAQPGRIDDGALTLPAMFELLGDVVLTLADGDSICVFPSTAFDRFCRQLEAEGQRIAYHRAVFYGCPRHVGPDGLLPIPETLRSLAEIDGDVVILGLVDHIEIFDAKRFAAAVA